MAATRECNGRRHGHSARLLQCVQAVGTAVDVSEHTAKLIGSTMFTLPIGDGGYYA